MRAYATCLTATATGCRIHAVREGSDPGLGCHALHLQRDANKLIYRWWANGVTCPSELIHHTLSLPTAPRVHFSSSLPTKKEHTLGESLLLATTVDDDEGGDAGDQAVRRDRL